MMLLPRRQRREVSGLQTVPRAPTILLPTLLRAHTTPLLTRQRREVIGLQTLPRAPTIPLPRRQRREAIG
ncbi:unnamed protein product [Strongylus vulgaris]|uniref:Uncharacterized protein n=1 Tax=Strongylus vulgaris TaxID=40348 RepID=A0A3P7ISL2_STRVU|nr:unnamed protein product [Strongylus vulgaris]